MLPAHCLQLAFFILKTVPSTTHEIMHTLDWLNQSSRWSPIPPWQAVGQPHIDDPQIQTFFLGDLKLSQLTFNIKSNIKVGVRPVGKKHFSGRRNGLRYNIRGEIWSKYVIHVWNYRGERNEREVMFEKLWRIQLIPGTQHKGKERWGFSGWKPVGNMWSTTLVSGTFWWLERFRHPGIWMLLHGVKLLPDICTFPYSQGVPWVPQWAAATALQTWPLRDERSEL